VGVVGWFQLEGSTDQLHNKLNWRFYLASGAFQCDSKTSVTNNMDGLSAAASIVAVIEISGRIFGLCRTYYSEVKNARDDIRYFRDEVTSLQDVLTNVKDLADAPDSAKLSTLDLFNQPDGLISNAGQNWKAWLRN
jgi:hypothetical protein